MNGAHIIGPLYKYIEQCRSVFLVKLADSAVADKLFHCFIKYNFLCFRVRLVKNKSIQLLYFWHTLVLCRVADQGLIQRDDYGQQN